MKNKSAYQELDQQKQNINTMRVGMIFGVFIYSVFGVLDLFMMPSNYVEAWIIRYVVAVPAIIILFVFSYNKKFYFYQKTILVFLLFMGQLGIVAMIYISKPGDPAFYTYYAGLILTMLWASFIFRLKFMVALYIAISTVSLYIINDIINLRITKYKKMIINAFVITSY